MESGGVPPWDDMSFDVSVAHEVRCVRITVRGDPKLGRLLSLLQVLEIDSASWPRDAVLVDLRALLGRLSPDEQSRLAEEAARALRRMRKIAVLAAPGAMRESSGVRVFVEDGEAQQWFAQG